MNVICFGDLAETIAKDAKKGDKVYVQGAISLANWTNSEGEARSGLAVSATRAERLFGLAQQTCEAAAQPSLPIVLPAIRKKKRPAFGLFRRKAKKIEAATSDAGDGRPF